MMAFATRFFTAYASYISQALWIFISFFVLTVFPLMFGVQAYGRFAATTAFTFIIQKIVDLVAESNISGGSYTDTLKSTFLALFIAVIPASILEVYFESEIFKLKYFLLFSTICSNLVLNISFQIMTPVRRAIYLTLFSINTVFISTMFWVTKKNDILTILSVVNLCGSIIGLFFIISSLRSTGLRSVKTPRRAFGEGLIHHFKDVVSRFLFSSFSLIVTYGSVLVASQKFSYGEIGIFRIFLTIVSMGAFISPVNPKELYRIAFTIRSYADILEFFWKNSIAYFVFFATWVICFIIVVIMFDDAAGILLYAITIYACSLYSSVIEKVFLANFQIFRASGFIAAYSAAASLILLVPDRLPMFALTMTGILMAYPAYLSLLLRGQFYRASAVPVLSSALLLIVALLI